MIAPLPRLALIAGPTASGKSALALALAERTNGVVINADASQVYRDLRILSARPSTAEEARVPHRLFGYLDGDEACSAARWAADARVEVAAAQAAGQLPVVVGGTGLYLRTLIDGITAVPPIAPEIREAVRALPVAEAYAALEREDTATATRLPRGDTTRIARALEVVRSTGRTIDAWRGARVGGIGATVALTPLVLLPDRAAVFERCDARLVEMFEEGAIEEVRALLARDLPEDAPVRRAIGVREIAAMLGGEITRAVAIEQAQGATRRYAKRQYTWFRHQPPSAWPRITEVTPHTLKYYFNLWP